MPELIGEQILRQHGSFKMVRRWYRGRHPHLGILQPPWAGLSGDWETIVEKSVVQPIRVYEVRNNDDLGGSLE